MIGSRSIGSRAEPYSRPVPSATPSSLPPVVTPLVCPGCGSPLLQPLRCEARRRGESVVDLRCPECYAWTQDTLTDVEMRELDARQAALRKELVRAYERCVAESMEALAVCLGMALELDLLGADDFAPRPLSASRRPRPAGS